MISVLYRGVYHMVVECTIPEFISVPCWRVRVITEGFGDVTDLFSGSGTLLLI